MVEFEPSDINFGDVCTMEFEPTLDNNFGDVVVIPRLARLALSWLLLRENSKVIQPKKLAYMHNFQVFKIKESLVSIEFSRWSFWLQMSLLT